MADGILSGLRVADFSRVLAGPYATMMLADFGADVVKIESPAGDDTRSWRPPVDDAGESTYFASVNRNKRSVVCHLGTPDGLAAARRLAETADVLVENFRPGVMERFGLDEDSLRSANPGLVYCSITGFGRAEGAVLPGYDLLVQAVGGLMSADHRLDRGEVGVRQPPDRVDDAVRHRALDAGDEPPAGDQQPARGPGGRGVAGEAGSHLEVLLVGDGPGLLPDADVCGRIDVRPGGTASRRSARRPRPGRPPCRRAPRGPWTPSRAPPR